MANGCLVSPDLRFIKDIRKAGGNSLKKCFQCATCSVTCSHSPSQSPFPRKEMILAQWGQTDRLVADPDIWLCYQCNDCSISCPRGAKPADVLGAIRTYVYKYYSFPAFLGKALASPAALPGLILIPMLVILVMMLSFTGANLNILNEEIEFSNFIPQLWLEVLFIGGNILIFLFAFIGLWRFWRALQDSSATPGQTSFLQAMAATALGIISHSKFKDCDANGPRYLAHILVFFGFTGAMITAGLAVMGLMLVGLESPIPLANPIKWLGNLSGAAGFVGLTIMIVRKIANKAKVGANGYSDWLFIVMLYVVFITGMSAQFARLVESAAAAYSIYYVHLVAVFFLLWYAPYSKFAHMFYRSLALVHARQIGRTAR
jgi:quinone-modifying oxidoreductase subunit QmoC